MWMKFFCVYNSFTFSAFFEYSMNFLSIFVFVYAFFILLWYAPSSSRDYPGTRKTAGGVLMRLLIAEGDAAFAHILKTTLERQKYGADIVTDGNDALDYALSDNYGAILLDLSLPGMGGAEVTAALRREGQQVPVMLLAGAEPVKDRVAGLDAGADDCLVRPFASTELLARIRAMLRRGSVYVPGVLTLGSLTLDTSAYRMSTPAGAAPLNNKEFQVLELFMRSPRSVFSAQQLMERVWGWDARAEINVVWTNIASLRRKMAALQADVTIRLVRGVGYVLEVA